MTLDELYFSLPNGLHDAELCSYTIDLVARTAQLILDVWVGDDVDREAYRPAALHLDELHFWIVEPPGPGHLLNRASVRIDTGNVAEMREASRPQLPEVPADAFVAYAFVSDWNSFIYFAAKSARLEWHGPSTSRS